MDMGGSAMPYEELNVLGHRLELDGRERLVVTGVEEVERFDEEEIVMATTAGTLVVGGTGLHIGKLNLDGGELHVDGSIHTLLYEDTAPGGQGGFLRRLFG
jgi:sporulation protein YabP